MHERWNRGNSRREFISDGCLLCSEDKPNHRPRGLVPEYLNENCGDIEIIRSARGFPNFVPLALSRTLVSRLAARG